VQQVSEKADASRKAEELYFGLGSITGHLRFSAFLTTGADHFKGGASTMTGRRKQNHLNEY
jgi:hypothetical protein